MEQRGRPQFRAEDMPGLQGIEIHVGPSEFGDEAAAFTSTQRNRPVGFLDRGPGGKIGTAYVHRNFRRRGIGRAMQEAAGNPPHSEVLTEMGNAWRQNVGGEQPEQRGEARVPTPALDEDLHEQLLLPMAAEDIRRFGALTKSRGESFHGA